MAPEHEINLMLHVLVLATVAPASPLTATEVVRHMVQSDNESKAEFLGYAAMAVVGLITGKRTSTPR